MENTARNVQRKQSRSLAAIGLAAVVAIAGCGGGDGSSEEKSPPTVPAAPDGEVLPLVGFTPTIGAATEDYPVTSFTLPLFAKGFMSAGEHQQDYAFDTDPLRSCTIAMTGILSYEPTNDLAEIEKLVADRATIAGGFAMTADRSAGDNFSFWRLGEVGTENWSSFFYGTNERWSGTGQQAVVEAKFFYWDWTGSDGKQQGFPVLGIRVRWAGEATENLSSRTASGFVEFECYFAPTGDQLIARDPLVDANGNEILDDDEAEQLRHGALISSHSWLTW